MVYIGKTMAISSVSAVTPAPPSYAQPSVARDAAGAALSVEAVDLSAESAVVATLGGGSGGGAAIYSAAGLLGALEQAGVSQETIAVPKPGSNAATAQTAQQALDQGILSAYSAAGSTSGVYTAGGGNGLSDQASSNWADILKSDPSYASTVVGSSFDSGIISTISVTA